MLTPPALIGVALALAIVALGRFSSLDRDRALYPVTLIVIASYYVLFATMGGARALPSELMAATVFVVVAIVGFRTTLGWVAAGIAGHGIFDWVVHPRLIAKPSGTWQCGRALGCCRGRARPERSAPVSRGRWMTGMTASSNTAASVKQRLLNFARKRGVEFNQLLLGLRQERVAHASPASVSRASVSEVARGGLLQQLCCHLHRADAPVLVAQHASELLQSGFGLDGEWDLGTFAPAWIGRSPGALALSGL
jgi:hypothetical protein